MTKLILTASILSLLTAPAFATEEGFFSKLEQGIKAEANTQIQGVVGNSIKGNVSPSVQRAVKPAASELVKGAVDVSSSAIKPNNTQNVEIQEPTLANAQPKPVAEPVKSPEPVFPSSTLPVPAKTLPDVLDGGIAALTNIPTPKVASRFKRQCSAWRGNGQDCMMDDDAGLNQAFPQRKDRAHARLGITTVFNESYAWGAVFDPKTGELNMGKATEIQIRDLGYAVERTNELVEKGIIHPDTIAFRECIKRRAAIRTDGTVQSKADLCS